MQPLSGADLVNAELPDEITGTTGTGSTAEGGRDNFTFTGRLAALTLEGGPARVFINGEQVDPAQYRTTTPNPTATPTPTPEPAVGPKPPLDPEAIANSHEEGLRRAGSFVVNDSSTLRDPTANGPDTDRRGAEVDLDADTAYLVSRPTEEATRYTYAEGATAYKKELLEGVENPKYEVDELGRPLAESLVSSPIIAETVRAVDYERSGTITREGRTLAVYVTNGSDSVNTDKTAFQDENISAFRSTLIVDPETGIVQTLRTERTTDYLSSGEPVTIVETLRFSSVGSTTVEQPGWVERLQDR